MANCVGGGGEDDRVAEGAEESVGVVVFSSTASPSPGCGMLCDEQSCSDGVVAPSPSMSWALLVVVVVVVVSERGREGALLSGDDARGSRPCLLSLWASSLIGVAQCGIS